MGGLGAGLRTIQWDLSKLAQFPKNFYMEHPDVQKMTDDEAHAFRTLHAMTIVGDGIPKVCLSLLFCNQLT